ncbi:MAG: hypothetical protein ACLFN0_06295 [Thermovirgaceae bacterium]
MRIRNIFIFLVALCVMLAASVAVAAEYDYEDMIPVLPDSIGGMEKSDDPDGGNLENSGQTYAAVEQKYSDGAKRIRLMVVAGDTAPQVQKFRELSLMEVETEEAILKSTEISGREAFFQIRKDQPGGTLGIAVQNDVVAAIETNQDVNENDLISLGEEIPVEEIADSVTR